jgi:hypothetical protein
MKIKCLCCEREINLDHEIFENYAGPVKCFGCSAMLELNTQQGDVRSLDLLPSQAE